MALIMGIESFFFARRKLRIRSTRTDAVYKNIIVKYGDAIVVGGTLAARANHGKRPTVKDNAVGITA